MKRLHLVPVRFRDACRFVEAHHRHHGPPQGMRYAVGVADDDGVLRGVVVVGRPVARLYDNGQTVEVTRVATDGTAHACSMLYGAAWRAAKTLGYTRLISYTQAGESGAGLRAAGWRVVAHRRPHLGWWRPSRPRHSNAPTGVQRTLWEAV